VNLSAFDPGSRLFGWAAGDGQANPTVGAWSYEHVGDDIGHLLDMLDRDLNGHFDEHHTDVCAYESPLLVINSKRRDPKTGRIYSYSDKLPKIRRLYNMGGHIEFVCRRRAIPCFEVSLFDMKRELAGMATAKKPEMVAVAEKIGIALPTVGAEDAADATAAWLLLLRKFSPALSARFDARIWGARGHLV
jgi:Holliday junction resolvasome RuvABC endonuclease subunit